ncbi:MAG: TetR/AcrR family transcriptional regulator [Bacteroidota bacterium]
MPLQTFHNLSEDRQAQILDIAFEEFAMNDFDSASVSRIVKRLQLAKGSFYRYFSSKVDLYAYLMEVATQKRLENVEHLFEHASDFYELLVQNFYMKIKFDLAHPLIGQFLYNTSQERNSEVLGNLLIQTKQRIMGLTKPLLQSFQANGSIRTDIDSDLLAFAVVQIQMGIYDYLSIQHGINLRERALNRNPVLDLPPETIMRIVRMFAEFLRTGLKPATT